METTTTPTQTAERKRQSAFVRTAKRTLATLLFLLVGSLLLWAWYVRERIADLHLEDTIKDEVARVENRLDERGNAIEARLDRIEGKLDRLLNLLEPRLTDGMTPSD